MNNAKSTVLIVIFISIFGLLVVISSYFLTLKRDALQFHTRDYNYFIEQAARLTDPLMTKRFTLNIEGYNFLGLQGVEGVKSLYHAIHAEYFRYTYVVLYRIFHSTLPIFIFYSAIFFLPILYFALIAYLQGVEVWKQAFLFTLLYVLFPATLYAVTADLRPRMLFIPAWCLVILAIYYNRPFIEKLVCFVLLLSIREEAILLAAFVIVLNFVHMQGKAGRWKQTFVFLSLNVCALVIFLSFMAWGEFDRVDTFYDPRNILNNLQRFYLPLMLIGVSLISLLGWYYFKRRAKLNRILFTLVYLVAILFASAQLARWLPIWYSQQNRLAEMTSIEFYSGALTNPLNALPFYMGFLLLALLWDFTHGLGRKTLVSAVALLCAVSAVTTLATFPKQITAWKQNLPSARLVWDFVYSHDRLQTDVLLDYETYQAFYNYDKVLVYNRLPLWLALPENRSYPDNKSAIVRHIRRRMDYSVISQASLENVLDLAQIAGVPVTEVASNEHYIILRFGD